MRLRVNPTNFRPGSAHFVDSRIRCRVPLAANSRFMGWFRSSQAWYFLLAQL